MLPNPLWIMLQQFSSFLPPWYAGTCARLGDHSWFTGKTSARTRSSGLRLGQPQKGMLVCTNVGRLVVLY